MSEEFEKEYKEYEKEFLVHIKFLKKVINEINLNTAKDMESIIEKLLPAWWNLRFVSGTVEGRFHSRNTIKKEGKM